MALLPPHPGGKGDPRRQSGAAQGGGLQSEPIASGTPRATRGRGTHTFGGGGGGSATAAVAAGRGCAGGEGAGRTGCRPPGPPHRSRSSAASQPHLPRGRSSQPAVPCPPPPVPHGKGGTENGEPGSGFGGGGGDYGEQPGGTDGGSGRPDGCCVRCRAVPRGSRGGGRTSGRGVRGYGVVAGGAGHLLSRCDARTARRGPARGQRVAVPTLSPSRSIPDFGVSHFRDLLAFGVSVSQRIPIPSPAPSSLPTPQTPQGYPSAFSPPSPLYPRYPRAPLRAPLPLSPSRWLGWGRASRQQNGWELSGILHEALPRSGLMQRDPMGGPRAQGWGWGGGGEVGSWGSQSL